MGAFGQRQEHADAHHRLPRRPDRGPVLPRRCRRREPRRVRARCRAQPQDRLRVPELQPHSPHDRDRERRASVGLCGRQEGRTPRTRVRRAWNRSGWPIVSSTPRTSSPAGSNSASPSRGRSSRTLRSSSPTNPPARSTANRRATCSISSTSCTTRAATIIVITHEHDVAERAARVIRLRDGTVIADDRRLSQPAHMSAGALT